MKSLKGLLYLFLLIFCSISVHADEIPVAAGKGAVTGRVTDEKGYVLPGATIIIKPIEFGVTTDVNGFFRISGLSSGNYTVVVSYIGFETESTEVSLRDNVTEMINFKLKEGIALGEVVVTGVNAQAKAIAKQRANVNVSNVISSDQVSKFPDSNIGDALKRIPGINVQYDQGEARFGHIRGTSPDLSAVTVNGERLPSAEAEMRSVQLDLIPSDMIQSIEVNKVVMPEMDADAIGGSVNLITKNQPAQRRITATAGSGWNLISEKPTWNFGVSYGDRLFNQKLGFVAAISYNNNPMGSDNMEVEWETNDAGKTYMINFQNRQYFVQRERQSYSLALDYIINANHKLGANLMYNRRKDWENRYRFELKDIEETEDGYIAETRRQVKFGPEQNKWGRLEDQKVQDFTLNGEHHFGILGIDWRASYAKASEERPYERYITYRAKKTEFTQNLTNTREPQVGNFNKDINDWDNFSFKELYQMYQFTDDEDMTFSLNFSLPLVTGTNSHALKFGAKYKGKSKMNNEDQVDYSPEDEDIFYSQLSANLIDMTRDNFLAGPYSLGLFPDKKWLGRINLKGSDFSGEVNEEINVGDFDAEEDIVSAYLRYDYQYNEKMNLILGARVEHTSSVYNAHQWVIDADGDGSLKEVKGERDSYTNFLPSVIMRYKFSDKVQLKGAYTNTIARPKYFDLAPHQELNYEDNEVVVGNPNLKPTLSMNFDLMSEFYLSQANLISLGFFYKDIKDFIVEKTLRDYNFSGNVWNKYKEPVNAGDASLFGIETSVQQKLFFLPGFLKNLSLYANYTYNYSKVKHFNIEDREEEELRLPGTPAHTLNASLAYESKKLTARISYNFASDFIDELGSATIYDRYYDKVNYLDLNLNYKIGKYLNVYGNVNNMLNQPLRYYQGSEQYTMQAEYYNVRFDAGVKLTF